MKYLRIAKKENCSVVDFFRGGLYLFIYFLFVLLDRLIDRHGRTWLF